MLKKSGPPWDDRAVVAVLCLPFVTQDDSLREGFMEAEGTKGYSWNTEGAGISSGACEIVLASYRSMTLFV
jgi:hypothetical protein